MFVDFFYKLRDVGVPASPTAFLTLHRALAAGLVGSLEDFYTAARCILVKSERYFDLFDQVFAHQFKGAEMPDPRGLELDALARSMLEAWLQNPAELSRLEVVRFILEEAQPDFIFHLAAQPIPSLSFTPPQCTPTHPPKGREMPPSSPPLRFSNHCEDWRGTAAEYK